MHICGRIAVQRACLSSFSSVSCGITSEPEIAEHVFSVITLRMRGADSPYNGDCIAFMTLHRL
jgi:hypothetical protein